MITREQRHNIITGLIALAVMLLMVFLGGCRPTQSIESIQTVEYHDTLIITEQDSALVQALIECDAQGNLLIQEIKSLQGNRTQAGTTYQYLTPQQLQIKTRFITIHDTIRVPTYRERITQTKTIHPKEKRSYWFVWLFIGGIIGFLTGSKIFR